MGMAFTKVIFIGPDISKSKNYLIVSPAMPIGDLIRGWGAASGLSKG
jgi:hypothetical protein